MSSDELAIYLAKEIDKYLKYQKNKEKIEKRISIIEKALTKIFKISILYSLIASLHITQVASKDPSSIKNIITWDLLTENQKLQTLIEDFSYHLEKNPNLSDEQKEKVIKYAIPFFNEYVNYIDRSSYIGACYSALSTKIMYCDETDLNKHSNSTIKIEGNFSPTNNTISITNDEYLEHELLHAFHSNLIDNYKRKLIPEYEIHEELYASVLSDNGYQDLVTSMYLLKELIDKEIIAKSLIQGKPEILFDEIERLYSKEDADTYQKTLLAIYLQGYKTGDIQDYDKIKEAKKTFVATFMKDYIIKTNITDIDNAKIDILIDLFLNKNIYFDQLTKKNHILSSTFYVTNYLTIEENIDDNIPLPDLIIKKATQHKSRFPFFYIVKEKILEEEGIDPGDDPDNSIFYSLLKSKFDYDELKKFLTKCINKKLSEEELLYLYKTKKHKLAIKNR